MNLMPIISQLEQKADEDDKMRDGLQYAIDLLRKFAISECEQEIANAKFEINQRTQEVAMPGLFEIPKLKPGGVFRGCKLPFIS